MTTPIFFTANQGDCRHTLIVGTSGHGKSVLLQAEANRLGITYEALLERMEPASEQKEQERMLLEHENRAEDARLNAVKEAFWANTPEGHHDLDQLHDALVVTDVAESPTPKQVKALFMMLPADIIGSGLAWGFSDTEVRERVCEFVEQNKTAVLAALTI